MMQHYLQTKKEYPGCILFYRLGDFYEMFFEDAEIVSRELELTLTGKSCGLPERAPMCGVPFHAVDSYLTRLVEKGYKAAICEQVEDPRTAKGMVKREVIRIVTPGTNLDMDSIEEGKNNFIFCILYSRQGKSGIKWCLKVLKHQQKGKNRDTIAWVNRLASEFESCIVHHENHTEKCGSFLLSW